MKELQRTSKSVLVQSSSGLLVIRGYTLFQTTIDNLDDDIFNNIFQYLSTQFDLTSFKINSDSISLYCGLILKGDNIPVTSELDQKFIPHLNHIIPSMLSYEIISGYNIEFDFLSDMTPYQNSININSTHFGVFSLYDLDILQTHSSILKILLDDENTNLYYSQIHHRSKLQSFITLKIEASSYHKYQNILNRFTQSMKQSPYISGKLYIYTIKDISRNPGLFSLGITQNPLSSHSFYGLMKLISSYLPQPVFPKIPSTFRRINLHGKVSGPVTVVKPFNCPSKPSIPEFKLAKSFLNLGWKIKDISRGGDYSVASLSNEDLVIQVVYDLKDHSLDPASLTGLQSSIVFLLATADHSVSQVHHNWTILSGTAKIKSLILS